MKTISILVMLLANGSYTEKLDFSKIEDCKWAAGVLNEMLPKQKEISSRSLRPDDSKIIVRWECIPGVIRP